MSMKSRIKKFFSRLFSSKRPFKLTRPGWVFILYSIGVGSGEINTGNNLLYIVFGIFLGLLLASGALSDLSLWGLDVTWIFPTELRAGERADVWMSVRNGKHWWSSLGVSIIFVGKLGDQAVRFSGYAPCVRRGETVQLSAGWVPAARGEFTLEQVRVSTRYPFGLLEKWWRVYRGEPAFSKLVLPARVPVPDHFVWEALAGDDRSASRNAQHEGASSSTVRDYRAGDNPRRIHWRASAKRGAATWLVRQMEPEEQHHVRLVLPAPASMRFKDPHDIGQLVAFTSSFCDKIRERGWAVEMVLDDLLILEEALLFALWDPRAPWTRGRRARPAGDARRSVPVAALFERFAREPRP
jgi:uncharacterized protein (DUF58 family)